MAEKQVILEMKGHDLNHKETIGVLPRQHIIILEKTDSQASDTK